MSCALASRSVDLIEVTMLRLNCSPANHLWPSSSMDVILRRLKELVHKHKGRSGRQDRDFDAGHITGLRVEGLTES